MHECKISSELLVVYNFETGWVCCPPWFATYWRLAPCPVICQRCVTSSFVRCLVICFRCSSSSDYSARRLSLYCYKCFSVFHYVSSQPVIVNTHMQLTL